VNAQESEMFTTPSPSPAYMNATNTTFSQIVLAQYVGSFAGSMVSLALLTLAVRKILCCPSLDKPLNALAYFQTWFAISVSFTMFNKFVFTYWGDGEFNVPFFFTSIHMFVKFCTMLTVVKIFQRGDVAWPSCRHIFTIYIPIGVVTGLDIAFANLAVSYAPVSLVVVTKTMGIVFTLSISVFLGLQQCTKMLVAIVVIVAVGSFLALWQEPDFQLMGTLMAALSSLCGAIRWSMTQSVSQREKATVPTLILFTAPAAMLVTFVLSMATETDAINRLAKGTYGESTWLVLALIGFSGGLFTLVLLVVEIRLVSLTSALATDVGAKVKDMALILISMAVYGDRLTALNMVGFLTVCVGVVSYSVYKQMVATKTEQVQYSAVQWEDDDVWQDDEDDDSFNTLPPLTQQEVELTNI